MTKWVYRFGNGAAEGRADMKNLLGGKGAGLAEMSNLGLPVPPGLTITTEACTYFYGHGKSYPPELREQVADGLAALEHSLGARFGDAELSDHLRNERQDLLRISVFEFHEAIGQLGSETFNVELLDQRFEQDEVG